MSHSKVAANGGGEQMAKPPAASQMNVISAIFHGFPVAKIVFSPFFYSDSETVVIWYLSVKRGESSPGVRKRIRFNNRINNRPIPHDGGLKNNGWR
jgi:hypothetical protein